MRTTPEILRDIEPFPKRLISHLPPRNEAYVSWKHYAQRLLHQHGGHRYTVTGMAVSTDGMWGVSVRIQFSDDEWYDGVGSDKEPDKAESQAYKRACSKAGIGLHLYDDFWLLAQLQKDSAQPTGITLPLAPTPKGEPRKETGDTVPAEGSARPSDYETEDTGPHGDVLGVASGKLLGSPDGLPRTPEQIMAVPAWEGTNDEIRARVEELHGAMTLLGVWAEDAFRHHLAAYLVKNELEPRLAGEIHWGDLRRKEHMAGFAEATYKAAARDIAVQEIVADEEELFADA